jgi:hypothetical protein
MTNVPMLTYPQSPSLKGRGLASSSAFARDRKRFANAIDNALQSAIDIRENFVIGDTHNRESQSLKFSVAYRVFLALAQVHRSINLDNLAGGVTVKVNNEAMDQLLPPEVQAAQSIGSQSLPQKRLFTCLRFAKRSNVLDFLQRDVPARNDSVVHLLGSFPWPLPFREGVGDG